MFSKIVMITENSNNSSTNHGHNKKIIMTATAIISSTIYIYKCIVARMTKAAIAIIVANGINNKDNDHDDTNNSDIFNNHNHQAAGA